MKALKFYDVKARKAFLATKYTFKTRDGRRFAVTKAPSGIKAWRIVPKGFKG